jgi:hypothetical protein
MLDYQQLQELVNKYLDLVEIDRDAILDARNRAAKFLIVQSHLSNHLKLLEDTKVKASTIEKASYAQAMGSAGGKNVTENKISAEADPGYTNAREVVERIDAELNWTKRHFDIFENAHVMFRQIAAERQ